MRPATFSLRGRFTIVMLLTFIIGAIASALFTYFEVNDSIKEIRKRTLQGQTQELLEHGLSVAPDGTVKIAPPPDWANFYRPPNLKFSYTLYDSGGRVVAMSPNLDAPLPQIDVGPIRVIGPDRKYTVAVSAPNGHILVVGRARANLEALAERLLAANTKHYTVLLVFMLVSLPVAWLICGWSLQSLERASSEAAAIGPESPFARISTDGLPKEARPLVDATNGALERLARAIEAERHLTVDVAHQLRTPLTVLDLRLQHARMDGGDIDWPAIIRDMEQLRRMVGQLVDLARMDYSARARQSADHMAEINLSRLAREAAAAALPLAESMGRELSVDATPEPMLVIGHADQIRDAIGALIDNALMHGKGSVQVSVRPASREDGAVEEVVSIVVRDEGEGVPPELREKVFDRFQKGSSASPGAGLGLAIVREIARAHEGTAGFDPGDGRWVRLDIPATRNASVPFPAASEEFRPALRGDHPV